MKTTHATSLSLNLVPCPRHVRRIARTPLNWLQPNRLGVQALLSQVRGLRPSRGEALGAGSGTPMEGIVVTITRKSSMFKMRDLKKKCHANGWTSKPWFWKCNKYALKLLYYRSSGISKLNLLEFSIGSNVGIQVLSVVSVVSTVSVAWSLNVSCGPWGCVWQKLWHWKCSSAKEAFKWPEHKLPIT